MSAKADRIIDIGDSSKCSQHAVCVTSLHSNRQTLAEENSRTSRPTSLIKSSDCSPHRPTLDPDVSIATGLKSTTAIMSLYFCIFFSILLLTRPTQTDWNWPEDGTGRTCLDTWRPMPDISLSLPGQLCHTIRPFTTVCTERMWFPCRKRP
jgi:hypothetical protein